MSTNSQAVRSSNIENMVVKDPSASSFKEDKVSANDGNTKDDDKKKNHKEQQDDRAISEDSPKNVQPFPLVWIEPAAATLGASNVEKALSTDKAPFTVVGYFSPSCGHCGHFFKTELPDMRVKYINPGKIKFGIRPYCHHPIDFVVTQLAWSRGPTYFAELFSLFMENQNIWFEFLLIPEKEKQERKKAIDAMIEKLPESVDRNRALVKFNINEENSMSSVLLFALSNGFSIDEIDAAINSPQAEDVTNQLIVAVLEAKNDEGEPVNAVPAFYLNDKYQNHPLGLPDFESLMKTGKIVSRPKEPTQTTILSSDAPKAALKAFTSIVPPAMSTP